MLILILVCMKFTQALLITLVFLKLIFFKNFLTFQKEIIFCLLVIQT